MMSEHWSITIHTYGIHIMSDQNSTVANQNWFLILHSGRTRRINKGLKIMDELLTSSYWRSNISHGGGGGGDKILV